MDKKIRILVVDDEETFYTVLSKELRDAGFEVETASDGDEAIALFEQGKRFDVVTLDIKMPKVDGFEVLKFLKKQVPTTKVIMLTGFADLKNVIESKKLGAEDIVSKPYDLPDLLSTIERVLQ